jgi:hypothetical protein
MLPKTTPARAGRHIKQKRVLADNAAFVVGLEDGRTDMFWDHELEEAR